MELTWEQFQKLEEESVEGLLFHDVPIKNKEDRQDAFRLFNLLPDDLQGIAISWGFDDSVFRDELFEFLCWNQFDMSVSEFYSKKMQKENEREIDFSKLENI